MDVSFASTLRLPKSATQPPVRRAVLEQLCAQGVTERARQPAKRNLVRQIRCNYSKKTRPRSYLASHAHNPVQRVHRAVELLYSWYNSVVLTHPELHDCRNLFNFLAKLLKVLLLRKEYQTAEAYALLEELHDEVLQRRLPYVDTVLPHDELGRLWSRLHTQVGVVTTSKALIVVLEHQTSLHLGEKAELVPE